MNIPQVVVTTTALFLAGCATNAAGPNFAVVAHAPRRDATTIYVFRDKATYAIQTPHVVKPRVVVDEMVAGNLTNGGFLQFDAPSGHHTLTIGDTGDTTTVAFDAVPGTSVYLQVWDKTRMQGARMAPSIVAFGLVGGAVGGAVAGAAIGASQEDVSGEGRTWHVAQMQNDQALATLQTLAQSN